MQSRHGCRRILNRARGSGLLAIVIPALVIPLIMISTIVIPTGTAFAKKPPKTYPEEGKIVGSGTTPRTVVAGQSSRTVYTHTYKVETETKIFELDCNKTPFIVSTGGECGGEKKLQIGDTIHFRIEKQWAYIPINDSTSNPDSPSEQRLRILSQDLKPDAKPSADSQAVPAEKTDSGSATKN